MSGVLEAGERRPIPKPRRIRDYQDRDTREELLAEVRDMAAGGATDHEIAKALGVHPGAIWEWQQKDEGFKAALRGGGESAIVRVERALFHKAVGYSYFKPEIVGDKVVPLEVHAPPDTAAMIFFLKNKRADVWREQQNLVVDGKLEIADPRQLALSMIATMRAAVAAENETPLIEGEAEE